MLKISKSILIFFVVLITLPTVIFGQAHKKEHILSFHSDIRIDSTGEIEISEHIVVFVTGKKIKRGIVRSLPLYRQDAFRNKVKIDFVIAKVCSGGKSAEYFTREESGTRSIYIGRQGVLLDTGTYNYDIVYRSKGHIGFFADYDELYWNVTGTDWIFPIDNASATIHFPAGAIAGKTSCYVGAFGANGSDCSATVNADQSVTFRTNKRIKKREGLTIAVAFSPGFIARPSAAKSVFNDYGKIILTVVLLVVLAAYFYSSWSAYGRNPEMPAVFTRVNVPRDFSPAMLRYCYKKTIDDKAFVASVMNMAVKKLIRISKEEGKSNLYAVEKISDDTTLLTVDEKETFNVLFAAKDKVKINASNGSLINKAKVAHQKQLSDGIDLKEFFVPYSKPLLRAVVLTIVALLIFMVFVDQKPAVILFFITLLIVGGGYLFWYALRYVRSTYGLSLILAAVGAAISGSLLYFVYDHDYTFVPVTIAFIWLTVTMFIAYVYLIPAPTASGALLLSEIAGFKMYLEKAEKDSASFSALPQSGPELFERLLPYALALDVENAWGAKFENLFAETAYKPEWYFVSGVGYMSLNATFYRRFNYAIQTSIPHSGSGSSSGKSGSSGWSSGSSGGGFSGGGGGGGGGGGW